MSNICYDNKLLERLKQAAHDFERLDISDSKKIEYIQLLRETRARLKALSYDRSKSQTDT